MIIERVKVTVAILGLLFTMAASSPSQAIELSEPQLLIQHVTERMLKALQQNKDELALDPTLIYPLVRTIILPNFDFDKMAKLVLGKSWRKASQVQRERFTQEFQLLLVRTYSTAMLEYSDRTINFLPFRDDVAKKKVKVPVEVLKHGSPAIEMSFSVYLDNRGVWKVYDVKIEGISLVVNYRSVFAKQVREGGMDRLIASLASQNRVVKHI